MNAVIVGGGKVGSELARTLVEDKHNVSVIDTQQKSLEDVSDLLDVMTYLGNGTDFSLLEEAGIRNADIFVAVTASDEVNLLASLMAKDAAGCETIARVRNPIYSREVGFFRKRLGISKIINPEQLAATEIRNLLQFPALSHVDFLEGGKVAVAMIKIKKGFGFVGKSLSEVTQIGSSQFKALVCGVMRDGEAIIPRGDFIIKEDDVITIVTTRDELRRFLASENINNDPAKNIIIVGAGTIAYYLTLDLVRRKRHVRVFDKDYKRCEFFSERFPEAEIICGDGTDRTFLLKNGIQSADAFVPLTGIDEENVIIATYVKTYFGAKVVTKINRTDMNDLVRILNLDTVVFPKLLCSDIIVQYVRALDAGARGNAATLYRYLDDSFGILEFTAANDPGIVGTEIMNIRLKRNVIIAGIVSGDEYEVPSGRSIIKPGDRVIIVTTEKNIATLSDIAVPSP